MFEGMTFDELNQLSGNPRSEPYDEYFSVMNINEEEKKKRISLAEKLEENFLYVLILLFTMQQYNAVDWDKARKEFESGYLSAISGAITVDEYMESYVKRFSYDVIDSTKAHESEPWYYSRDRAIFQSENESQTSFNHQEYTDAIKAGKTRKQWVDIRDKRERESHRAVGGTIKSIQDVFLVGDSIMGYPKDQTYSPSASQVANCRCTIKYF